MESNTLLYQIAFSYLYRNRLLKAHQLLDQYGSAEAVWKVLNDNKMNEALARARDEAHWIEQHEIKTYFYTDDTYPYRLKLCPDAPLMLYSKGNLKCDASKVVAIVGTRNATDRGRELAHKLVVDLARLVPDVAIVSGLAYGIDIAAQRAAVEAGLQNIIIPGHGLDRIYPTIHRNVAVQSLIKGGILTEYMSGTEPIGANFVARDRIIAGMADAVVVVESKERGGSLITAQMALDYDRQVFAFPGRVTDEQSRGCNQLIRTQKAALIECAEDLVDAMMWESEETKKKHQPLQTKLVELTRTLTDEERILLDKLHENEDGVHVNLLVLETGIPYNKVSSLLISMEFDELVRSLPGGIYRAIK